MPRPSSNPDVIAQSLTAYRGQFSQYVPSPGTLPTRLNNMDSDILTPSERHSGHVTNFASFDHGRKTVNKHHDYSYGRSKPHLRPVVSKESDDAWHLYEHEHRPKNWSKK